VIRSLSPRLKQTPHDVTIECPPHILVMSFPGALAQVVTNLVVNSVVHAYPDGRTGRIALHVRQLSGDRLELVYSDDGSGIPEANLDRIYAPFFHHQPRCRRHWLGPAHCLQHRHADP
jgi:signal transduction histidine kinase